MRTRAARRAAASQKKGRKHGRSANGRRRSGRVVASGTAKSKGHGAAAGSPPRVPIRRAVRAALKRWRDLAYRTLRRVDQVREGTFLAPEHVVVTWLDESYLDARLAAGDCTAVADVLRDHAERTVDLADEIERQLGLMDGPAEDRR